MTIALCDYRDAFNKYLASPSNEPLFLRGDAREVLRAIPDDSIDFCMTSPPYWGKREYHSGGIGLEDTPEEYIEAVTAIFAEVRRVLKTPGSFWLNMGDSYHNKGLAGIPWRIALKLTDEQGWILRNNVIWHKVKGGLDNTTDRLRNVHENLFHFVKISSGYYYDVDSIRTEPRKAKVHNGAVVSATGVTGVRYKRQIELSTKLTVEEKGKAMGALNSMLQKVELGEISDFRMVIRGQQRTTHSNSESVSGRAKELQEKGFYFLKYHPKGSKPGDVWDILPEDTQRRFQHYAPYPEDLCKIPILATCPPGGVALDPFCGTGTTSLVARILGRKSVSIDISQEYLEMAEKRCMRLL
ncbi:MAG: site-specific DNA-methyltransferase [Chloroflexi bacterium]|nr:site-specific DNA-methyltransferase [Ardenticatenaceae bacterium]MBL1131237.1 site-specific DNA-methyltransferase [Chloroflexota bacterium]NOG37338.1 site-specific DNA-methyltransferase [Chloroflexota bacterium]